jgi:2-keto-4-pentenoate hydratase/2-oxohepta-3-ene-1,7-dioic acid hydratase in catechol pathway
VCHRETEREVPVKDFSAPIESLDGRVRGELTLRWVTVATDQGPRACGVFQGKYVDVNAADPSMPSSVRGILALGIEGQKQAWDALSRGTVVHDPAKVKLLPPIPDARKVICIGLNYRDHAIESGAPIPEEPVIFAKFPSSLIADGDSIVLPSVSTQVDYEAELVVVVGKGGRHLSRAQAMDAVGGYMVGHDVSARDWQLNKPGKQWIAGKTFDTFAPTGPEVVAPDEVSDPHALGIRLRLNGDTMQDSNTNQLIFRIDELIAYLSQVVTLEPGDLIFTGTPPGVGMARKPPVFLKPGDVVEVEIDGLGILRNPVVGEKQ